MFRRLSLHQIFNKFLFYFHVFGGERIHRGFVQFILLFELKVLKDLYKVATFGRGTKRSRKIPQCPLGPEVRSQFIQRAEDIEQLSNPGQGVVSSTNNPSFSGRQSLLQGGLTGCKTCVKSVKESRSPLEETFSTPNLRFLGK